MKGTLSCVQALLTREAELPIRCVPLERPCGALLQISSYAFVPQERPKWHQQLRDRLRRHFQHWPESVVIFEDYEHMDCDLQRLLLDVRGRLSTSHRIPLSR
jgi:hypothetical protein